MLGQRTFGDVRDTNLLEFNRGQSFESGVLHDPHDPDPARRYKLFYWDQAALLLPAGTQATSVLAAVGRRRHARSVL